MGTITVKFENAPPTVKEIQEIVKINTGLNIELTHEGWTLESRELKEGLGIWPDGNAIVIHMGSQYLSGATLHTLIKMGGSLDFSLPIWTSQKYSEISLLRRIQYRTNRKLKFIGSYLLQLGVLLLVPFLVILAALHSVYSKVSRKLKGRQG
jgi:hypothetical protein